MALTLDDFVSHLADSRVVSSREINSALSAVSSGGKQIDVQSLAQELVRQKKLTPYQVQTVYAGKGQTLTVGSYIIIDKLGQGGMGLVLKAEHRAMKRLVALKVLSPAVSRSNELVQRFHREVEAAARLIHPNIVTAFDAGEANGTNFLVMEFVDGDDLAAFVTRNGRLSVEQAVDFITQASRGLEYAHSRGVIHRDIKPANLLLDRSGVVKILDMGLARIDAAEVSTQADLTGTGAVMGTVDYMAPEQAISTRNADARSDLYSLGISLWYLLTGRIAYEGDSLMSRMLAHRDQRIPSLRSIRKDVSEELDAIFQKLVSKEPGCRYQTATELIADLNALRPDSNSVPANGTIDRTKTERMEKPLIGAAVLNQKTQTTRNKTTPPQSRSRIRR